MRVCIVTFIYHYVLEKKLDVTEADIEFSRLHSSMVLHGAHTPLPSTHVLGYMDEPKRPEDHQDFFILLAQAGL